MITRGVWVALVWLLLVVLASVMAVNRLSQADIIDTNILNLLPAAKRDPIIRDAIETFYNKQAQRIVVVVSHPQKAIAQQALVQLTRAMSDYITIHSLPGEPSDLTGMKQMAALYGRYGSGLAREKDYLALKRGEFSRLVENAYQMLFSPMTAVSSGLLQSDPLFLMANFLMSLSDGRTISWYQDHPYLKKQNYHFFALGALKRDAFDLTNQQQFMARWQREEARLSESHADLAIHKTGALFYAQRGVQQAKSEISLVGTASLMAILVLLLWVFRGVKPLLLAGCALFAGVVCGFVVVTQIYGQIHLMALVFGATLLGVSIDYSFHFFSEYRFGRYPQSGGRVIRRIRTGLFLGLVSSSLAYLSLMFGEFPGLQQIALFSCIGLCGACLTVLIIYPLLYQHPRPESESHLAGLRQHYEQSHWRLGFTKKCLLLLGLSLVSLWFARQLSPNDDIRLLQSLPEDLRSEQRFIEELFQFHSEQRFFVVVADSVESLLVKEEALYSAIGQAVQKSEPLNVMRLSRYLPSLAQQQEVYELKKRFYGSDLVKQYSQQTGVPVALAESPPQDFLTLNELQQSPLGDRINDFLLVNDNRKISVVLVQGKADTEILASLEDSDRGVFWIDKVAEASAVFGVYRSQAGRLLLLACGVVFCLLLLRYGWLQGLLAGLVPVTSCTIVLAVLMVLNAQFNLFHLLGLMVVLGLGLDYAIFLSEKRQDQFATFVAVSLSVITTLLAFGLLSLSATMAVSSFGMVVLIGLLTMFWLSFLLLKVER